MFTDERRQVNNRSTSLRLPRATQVVFKERMIQNLGRIIINTSRGQPTLTYGHCDFRRFSLVILQNPFVTSKQFFPSISNQI
jgi:hypothetical protein